MREGWQTINVSNLILPSGNFDPRKKPDEYFRYVDVSGVSNSSFSIVEANKILGKDAPSRARRIIRSGDVIFATIRPTLRRIAIVPTELDGEICSTGYFVFRAKPEIEPKFLFYHLFTDAFMGAMEVLQSQALVTPLSMTDKSKQISFPPLPEQKRIVAILDEAFEGIDAAIANTKKNLSNARELFDSYLNDVFTKKGEGWVEKKLVQCVSSVSTGPFGSMLHKSDYVDGGIPIVNPINIIDDRIEANDNKTVSEETIKKLNTYILDVDDIVIGRRGEIGRCAVVQADQAGWLCGTGCFYIKPSKDLDPNFLVNLLRSSKYREELEKVATGATMKNLSNTSLKNMVIAFPTDPEEQYRFLALFDELSATTKNLETIYKQKLSSLNELKQSLLAKAFSGELTADSEPVLKEAVG